MVSDIVAAAMVKTSGLNPEQWLKTTLMALDDAKLSSLDGLPPLAAARTEAAAALNDFP